jgi:endonuclease YncB( thermonuclease family)
MCHFRGPAIKAFLRLGSRSSPRVIEILTLRAMKRILFRTSLGKLGALSAAGGLLLGSPPGLSGQNSGRIAAGGSLTCVVERVVDGDTFVCLPGLVRGARGERVRLLLIDTPELAQPFGGAVRDEALRIIPPGARVRLDFDVETRDRYGRLLAYVWVDSVMVNRELVRRGMALVAVYPPNVRHVETMRAAADSARAERKGLWAGSAFQCAPSDFRAGRCR